ncbi:MAG: hypothetical protein ACR2HS_04480 [Gammaproteobacteria bacterium]
MLTEHELGEKTALSLIKEMRFLGKLKADRNLDDLFEKVPNRKELGFQVIDKSDAAKSKEAKGNFGAELAGLRFCVGDGSVERLKMMDIDHTVPFAYLQKKQTDLLSVLNDSSRVNFKTGFLSVDGINNYFKQDAAVVKGTRRFFKLCYNDIDNLLLICHACNMDKSDNDSLEWFRKQEPFLGERFVKAVNDAGGLHDGIIVKKVCKVSSDLSDIVRIGEVECRLHDGEGKGLGEFVNEWFEKENPEYSKGIVSAYSNIWLQLQEIWELQLKDAVTDDKTGKDAQTTANKLTGMLDAQIKRVEKHYKLLTKRGKEFQSSSQDSSEKSHSTTDSPEDRKARIQLIDEDTKKLLKYVHAVKKIYSDISNKDPALTTILNKTQLYEFLETLNIRGLDLKSQENIFKKVLDQLTERYTQSPKTQTIDEIKDIIRQAVDEENPFYKKWKSAEEIAEKEKEKREAAEKKLAEAEKKIADTSEWVSLNLKPDGHSPSGQEPMLNKFKDMSDPFKQATSEYKENSASKERSVIQDGESSRSSSPEAEEEPPAKRRSMTPSPNRRSSSPSH